MRRARAGVRMGALGHVPRGRVGFFLFLMSRPQSGHFGGPRPTFRRVLADPKLSSLNVEGLTRRSHRLSWGRGPGALLHASVNVGVPLGTYIRPLNGRLLAEGSNPSSAHHIPGTYLGSDPHTPHCKPAPKAPSPQPPGPEGRIEARRPQFLGSSRLGQGRPSQYLVRSRRW